ncbi:MAG: radical SAM protein [Nitrososphaerales archaeon]|nr:radical SAM protein [Nitrososphaerales archaeon]
MIIGETESLCPVCLRRIPAQKIAENDNVFLEKSCPDHGSFKTIIWRGLTSYLDSSRFNVKRARPKITITESNIGCPFDCGLCPIHKQRTCVSVLEVTNRCNLNCPYCFASARRYDFDPDIQTIKGMYETLLKNCPKPICVQISGGEPTMRDDLPDIVAMGKEMGIDYIELNTNAVRLGKDLKHFKELKEKGVDALYFSFDGLTRDVYEKRCGVDLLDIKLKALENCSKLEMGVVLVPVIERGINYDQIGDIIRFAKKWVPTVNGVHFQPVSYFGRYSSMPNNQDRLTLPDILKAIETQTGGELKVENFTPTSCPNVHCDARSYSVVLEDSKLLPLTSNLSCPSCNIEDISKKTRDAIKDLWKFPEESIVDQLGLGGDPSMCGCEAGTWMDLIARMSKNYLTISTMAFQDVWNVEMERVQECCIHVVTPDKKLVPFCMFNITSMDGKSLYRENALSKT